MFQVVGYDKKTHELVFRSAPIRYMLSADLLCEDFNIFVPELSFMVEECTVLQEDLRSVLDREHRLSQL